VAKQSTLLSSVKLLFSSKPTAFSFRYFLSCKAHKHRLDNFLQHKADIIGVCGVAANQGACGGGVRIVSGDARGVIVVFDVATKQTIAKFRCSDAATSLTRR
jgi:hypothetical protein